MESDAYQVQQHVVSGEYYVLTEQDGVSVSLYLPRQARSILLQAVVGYDVVEEQSFSPEEWPFLKSGAADFYYITADYGTRTERIKVFLVQE